MAQANINNYKVVSEHKKMFFTCPYCGSSTKCIDSIEKYGTSYGYMWICSGGCDAYVGCHKGTKIPLGTLANSELRKLRNIAHSYFDKLWKGKAHNARHKKYAWLSKEMNIDRDLTHIALFGIEQCKECIRLARGILEPEVKEEQAEYVNYIGQVVE